MSDFAVIGAGHIGSEISKYLSQSGSCMLIDPSIDALAQAESTEKMQGTLDNNPEILSKNDLFVVALPGSVAKNAVMRLLREGKKVVDVSFYEDDPFYFSKYISGDAIYIPDAGFAPGLSNIMAGYLVNKYGEKKIGIYVGGLPAEPKEPFLHSITWSVEGFIDEYLRPARIIKDGMIVNFDPLENKIPYQPKNFVNLEGFYSDGLRTLLRTLPVTDIFELTLRYQGHLERMQFLKDMGYFSGGGNESPRILTQEIFSRFKDPNDVSILDVVALGNNNHRIELRDYGDRSIISMARLTGHTAALVALMMTENFEFRGFVPPEELGKDEKAVSFIFDRLRKEGVKIDLS